MKRTSMRPLPDVKERGHAGESHLTTGLLVK